MYKDVLRAIAGIEMFPVFSLLVFVTVFVVMLVWTWRLEPGRLAELAYLPLDRTDVGPGDAETGERRALAKGERS